MIKTILVFIGGFLAGTIFGATIIQIIFQKLLGG